MGRRQGIGGDVWNIFILEKKDAENQFFLHLFVWGSESGREWVLRRPGGRGRRRGKGFFPGPVGPGIAMSLGRKIMSGVPSIIFKSHLHGLKRNLKTPSPRPRPFPLCPAPHRTLSLSAAGRLCSEEGMEGSFGAVEMSAEGKMGKEKPEVWASGKNLR